MSIKIKAGIKFEYVWIGFFPSFACNCCWEMNGVNENDTSVLPSNLNWQNSCCRYNTMIAFFSYVDDINLFLANKIRCQNSLNRVFLLYDSMLLSIQWKKNESCHFKYTYLTTNTLLKQCNRFQFLSVSLSTFEYLMWNQCIDDNSYIISLLECICICIAIACLLK